MSIASEVVCAGAMHAMLDQSSSMHTNTCCLSALQCQVPSSTLARLKVAWSIRCSSLAPPSKAHVSIGLCRSEHLGQDRPQKAAGDGAAGQQFVPCRR